MDINYEKKKPQEDLDFFSKLLEQPEPKKSKKIDIQTPLETLEKP